MKNIEIKAKYPDSEKAHQILSEIGAQYHGLDHQIDRYFNCPNGRLKLRQGNIENNLIFYQRPDQAGPKHSQFLLHPTTGENDLTEILSAALGQKIVVDKQRHIYFLNHIKFHVDLVEGLGNFVEIEVTDMDDTLRIEDMLLSCQTQMKALGISPEDLVTDSYSDMLIRKVESTSDS